jgi:SAM-dependent methyltransferase
VSFDRFSATYDREVAHAIGFVGQEHDFFLEAKAQRLLSAARVHVGEPRALTFLDVGCGVGAMERFLVATTGSIVGVDVTPEVVDTARERYPSAQFLVYDGRTLPFDDGSFDVAFAVCVLHHVEAAQRPSLVREMARVVRRDGLVFVAEHNPWNPLTRLVVQRCAFDEGVELLSRREVEALLRASGLAVVESLYILFFPWRRAFLRAVEDRLGALALGAQHVVAGMR